MTRTAKAICVATFSVAVGFCSASKARQPATIPAGSKVYIAPMDGFETYMKTALETKKVPLVVVDNKQDAEFRNHRHSQHPEGGHGEKAHYRKLALSRGGQHSSHGPESWNGGVCVFL